MKSGDGKDNKMMKNKGRNVKDKENNIYQQ